MKKRLRVAVRDLVSHSLRSGDLNLESFGTSSPLDAIRAHQRLQNARGEGYRKEVTLTHVVEDEHFILEVGGRIDGVFETADPVIIEEIKTTNGDLDKRASREAPTHWGQLHVYAYIYALDNDLDAVIGRLTYYHLETGRTREIDRPLERHALQTIFEELARRYLARPNGSRIGSSAETMPFAEQNFLSLPTARANVRWRSKSIGLFTRSSSSSCARQRALERV